LKFRELRERAQKELGPRFDLKAFHDEMINGGTLPLDLLEARTDGGLRNRRASEPRNRPALSYNLLLQFDAIPLVELHAHDLTLIALRAFQLRWSATAD